MPMSKHHQQRPIHQARLWADAHLEMDTMAQGDLLSGAELQLAIAARPDLTWLAEAGGRVLAALVLRPAAAVATHEASVGELHPHFGDQYHLPSRSPASAGSLPDIKPQDDAVLRLVSSAGAQSFAEPCLPAYHLSAYSPHLAVNLMWAKTRQHATHSPWADATVLLRAGAQRALALGALWVQPALEDRSNLAFCLVNFVLQLLLLTPDVDCLMEGRP